MEKDRNTKIVALSALFIAVVGLTVGFAAFSSTLRISSSAQVTVDASNFDVNFSTVSTTETEGTVTPTVTGVGTTGAGATISNAGTAPSITGLKANFTQPGQTVKYSFYTHNNGQLTAYLKSVTYGNVTGQSVTKKCTALTGTSRALVDAACDGITIKTTVGTDLYTGSSAVTSKPLGVNVFQPVEVEISYASNAAVADGDFNVEFGDITLTYSSVD